MSTQSETRRGLSYRFRYSSDVLKEAEKGLVAKVSILAIVGGAAVGGIGTHLLALLMYNLAPIESILGSYYFVCLLLGFVFAMIAGIGVNKLIMHYGKKLMFDKYFYRTKLYDLAYDNFLHFYDWMQVHFKVDVNAHYSFQGRNSAGVQVMFGEYQNFVFKDPEGNLYCLQYVEEDENETMQVVLLTGGGLVPKTETPLTEDFVAPKRPQSFAVNSFTKLLTNENVSESLKTSATEINDLLNVLSVLQLGRSNNTVVYSVRQELNQLSGMFWKVQAVADEEFEALITVGLEKLKVQLVTVREELVSDAKSEVESRLSAIENGMFIAG